MKSITPEQAQEIFQEAKAVLVNDQVVADFLLCDIEHAADNEWLRVFWNYNEGQELYLIIPEGVGYIEGDSFIMSDDDGDQWKLTPLFCAEIEEL